MRSPAHAAQPRTHLFAAFPAFLVMVIFPLPLHAKALQVPQLQAGGAGGQTLLGQDNSDEAAHAGDAGTGKRVSAVPSPPPVKQVTNTRV